MPKLEKYDHYLLRKLRDKQRAGPDQGPSAIHVSVRYTGDVQPLVDAGLRMTGNAGGIAVGRIEWDGLDRLEKLDNVVYISTEPPLKSHLDTSIPEIHADLVRNGSPSYTGLGVVVGILDTGIDVRHKNFRRSNNATRIVRLWDQTINPTAGQHSPAPYGYGVEFLPADIQNAIDHPDQPFAHTDSVGHGTHVAGIAAGNGSQGGNCHGAGTYWGVAPDANLVVVKVLPDANSPNQNTSLTDAATYVFQQASALNPAQPAVINMSLEWGLTARDGTSNEETFLDGLLAPTSGRAIVVSAGNDGNIGDANDVAQGRYNAGTHSQKHVVANGNTTITVMVPPDDKKTDYIDLWYSAGAGRLSVTVTGPRAVVNTGAVAAGSGHSQFPPVGNRLVEITSTVNNPANNKGHISINLDPPPGGSIASGPWTIALQETAGTAVDVDLWIFSSHHDPHPVIAFPDRTQAATLTSPGTAKNLITVGAYASKTGDLADFSSRGPTRATDGRQKPDICAPGLEKAEKSGIVSAKAKAEGGCCCDCCYDFYVDMQGTSMAAPHVAGVVALMLERNANLTFAQIQATLQSFCRTPPGPAAPNNDWGFGKVDAQLAVANIPPGSAFNPPPTPPGSPGPGPGPAGPTDVSSMSSTSTRSSSTPEIVTRFGIPFPPLQNVVPAPSLRIGHALKKTALKAKDHPAGQIIIGLVSQHFDEVFRLINRNRRVATKWHRMYGPDVLRDMLWADKAAGLIPARVRNQDVSTHLQSLLDVLVRYGSARLQQDLQQYGALLLALPGAVFTGLPSPLSLETARGCDWNH